MLVLNNCAAPVSILPNYDREVDAEYMNVFEKTTLDDIIKLISYSSLR